MVRLIFTALTGALAVYMFLVFPFTAAASPRHNQINLRRLSSLSSKSNLDLGALSIKAQRSEIGLLELSLNSKKVAPVSAEIVNGAGRKMISSEVGLFDGTLRSRRLLGARSLRIHAGTYFSKASPGGLVLHIPLSLDHLKRRRHSTRNYELILRLDDSGGIVSTRFKHGPPILASNAPVLCGIKRVPEIAAAAVPKTSRATALATYFINMYIDVDSRFYGLYGADTPSIVAIVLDGVNTIYSEQLGYELRFAGQTIYADAASDPFSSTDFSAETLLEAFRTYAIARNANSADVQHLFTARRALTNAIGFGYVGVICAFSNFSVAWDDYASGFARFVQTTAHELGHNTGADHDFDDVASIMSGTGQANEDAPYFSALSLNEISSYVSQSGSCLSDSGDNPLPTPAAVDYPDPDEDSSRISIGIRFKKKSSSIGVVRGAISSSVNGKLAGRVVELIKLRTRQIVSTTFTNSDGKYSFRVTPRGGYYTADRMSGKTSVAKRF